MLHKLAQGWTPAHVRYAMCRPGLDTDALALGSALHVALLEPSRYQDVVHLGPVNPKTGRTYGRDTKAWTEAEDAVGAILLTTDQAAQVAPMIAALQSHPLIVATTSLVTEREVTCIATLDLRQIAQEQHLAWKAEWGEDDRLVVKTRLDMGGGGIIADLKTMTTSRRPGLRGIEWYAVEYGLMHQAALYPRVARACGIEVEHFAVLAIEKEEPYLPFYLRVSQWGADTAMRELLPAMVTAARCYRTDEWPGYPQDVVDLDPPEAWVKQVEAIR